ncbi:MAG: hypothetical protein K8T89_16555 [Planctomycetes bacterium]|nr:hypothetical protein [Planctomycetota bacterium]
MRQHLRTLAAIIIVFSAWSSANGQDPTVVAPAATPATATAAAGGAKNIWSMICLTPEQKAACKAKFCKSGIGKLINGMLAPAAAMTGGIIGPCCPDPNKVANPDDLKLPADSAQGAAAKIKAEEAQAKARIAALQYLATVDCRYYPEAEAALINGLRADKNECVRAEAAKAFARGCCCTPKVLKALSICVSNSNKDGFPAERSEYVLAFAYVALDRCLRSCMQAEPEQSPEKAPEKKAALNNANPALIQSLAENGTILKAGYYSLVDQMPTNAIYADARVALSKGLNLSPETLARLQKPRTVKDVVAPPAVETRLTPSTAEPPILPIAETKNAIVPAVAVSKSPPKSLLSIVRNPK